MDVNDIVLVSVDDHVVEPPDFFEGRLPARYADVAPRFVTREDGTNAWVYEDEVITNVALNAVAGRVHQVGERRPVGRHAARSVDLMTRGAR